MQSTNTSESNYGNGGAIAFSCDLDNLVSELQTILSGAVRQRIGGLFREYTVYKETHDAVMRIPAVVRNAQITTIQNQCQQQNQQNTHGAAASSHASELEAIIRRLTEENDNLKLRLAAVLDASSSAASSSYAASSSPSS